MLQVQNSITIRTLPFATGQTVLSFADTPELKSGADGVRRWKGLQVFGETELAKFDGLTLLDDADLDQSVLRLYNRKGDLKVQDLPLTALLRASNGGYYYELADLDIDLAQCQIIIQDSTGYAVDEIICFEVIYDITRD